MANTVLITGGSGLVGSACVERFLADGWKVIAVSRRAPELFVDGDFEHLSIDLRDAEASREALSKLTDVTHLVHAAVYEKPGLASGWAEQDYIDINGEMLRNVLGPLADVAALRHVTIMQGTKAYGVHLHPMRIPGRERQPRDEHPNFYWLQEDYLKAKAQEKGFTFTIFRPQMIVGGNTGVAMNLPPIIGVYAAICKELGRPFSFPGGISWVWEAADTRLVANAIRWAAEAPAAADQHFNLTNGDVFEWRDMWPAIADAVGLEPGPDEHLSLAEFLPAHADTWDRIVEKYALRPIKMADMVGESHHFADFAFLYYDRPPAIAFVSTVKIKQAGFTEVQDTEDSFVYWLKTLQERRIIPPA